MKTTWAIGIASLLILGACNDSETDTYEDKTTETTTSTNTSTNITSDVNVPDNVRTDFQTRYPSASNVTWVPYTPYDRINWDWTGWPIMDTTYYTVTYTIDNRPYRSWWDRNMNWIGSVSTIEDSTMLPEAVKNTIAKNYSGYRITSIDEENDKDKTAYEIELEKGNVSEKILIDTNGKILKKDTKA